MTSHSYDTVILGGRAGYVALAFGRGQHHNTRGAFDHHDWTPTVYRWPDEADTMRADVARETAVEPTDVYICPAVRHTNRRRKGDALPPMVCWADLDTEPADPTLLERLDAYIVASGQPGHQHLYVPLTEPVPLSTHAQLNKALAQRLGGDAKWSDESLLRLPGTLNHKTNPPGDVAEPDTWGGTVWSPNGLAELLGVSTNSDTNGPPPRLASVPDTETVEPETPPEPLPASVRRALEHPDTFDRSVAHARLVGACYDAGLTQGQAITLAGNYQPSTEKYGARVADEVTRWWGKVDAKHDQQQPAPVVPISGTSALAPDATVIDNDAHRGQFRIAQRLVAEHGQRLRYAHGLGWLIWNGTRWAPDTDGAPWRYVAATITAAMREAISLGKDQRDALLADVRKVESANGVRGVLDLAATMTPVAVATAELDADPQLFNTTNGTLDLRTGELRRADPADLITKVAGCEHDPEAHSATFAAFLATTLPNREVRDYMQRVCGSALLGRVREHILPICWGEVGGNGKGTLLDAVRKAFGTYGTFMSPDVLMDAGPRHTTEQTDLRGARFVTTSETNEGRPLAAATVKRLTGGDPIRARRMRQDTIEFEPSHTIVMLTNHKPSVSGDDPAMWRRIRLIPFDVSIPGAEQDERLPEKLETDLAAVLAWCVEGYRKYCENGLDAPDAVQARTDEYRTESDAIGRFLAERTMTSEFGTVRSGDLFSAWSAWCAANGETVGNYVSFARAMGRHGYATEPNNGRKIYRGLLLFSEGDREG